MLLENYQFFTDILNCNIFNIFVSHVILSQYDVLETLITSMNIICRFYQQSGNTMFDWVS